MIEHVFDHGNPIAAPECPARSTIAFGQIAVPALAASVCGRAARAGGDEVREDLGREVRRGVAVADGGVDDHRPAGCRRHP
jgi:hypothetical protein